MIEITQQARSKLQEKINQQKESVGVKIGVKKSGCSGYSYVMEYIAEDNLGGLVKHEIDGVEVYIDPKHNVFLEGMTIDFQKKGLNELFEFINPNESARCGCGESFTL
jgi:iron-sulfur cluster assembly protein